MDSCFHVVFSGGFTAPWQPKFNEGFDSLIVGHYVVCELGYDSSAKTCILRQPLDFFQSFSLRGVNRLSVCNIDVEWGWLYFKTSPVTKTAVKHHNESCRMQLQDHDDWDQTWNGGATHHENWCVGFQLNPTLSGWTRSNSYETIKKKHYLKFSPVYWQKFTLFWVFS